MELTKEYFDKGVGNILEKVADVKSDVVKLETKLTAKIDAQTVELKQYTTDAFTVQQEWMDERFKEQITTYDVRERVTKLEKEVTHLKLNRPAHA